MAPRTSNDANQSPRSVQQVLDFTADALNKCGVGMLYQSSSSIDSVVHYDFLEVIEPGMVIIRNMIPDSQCQRLAKIATEMGQDGEEGFYTTKGGDGSKKILNTGEAGRGRIYDAATRFPTEVTDCCAQAVGIAREADRAMPDMTCTHVLLNMYTSKDGLVWHRDIYENDGKSDHPVVNLCVGASCLFGFKHEDSDPDRVVKLNNGDCLLFGGRCRLIKHAVLEVLLDDCPDWMSDDPCRFSFTFRDSPEVLGREGEFKYFRCDEHLVGQDEFEVPTDASDWNALPSQESQRILSLS
mmetsp:Transcript_46048/g.68582  ORF Transcript_46048/g.68582 Transcript_46048/m.68582 type:complete len:297 (-) Transcript_46048:116-1006(-)|eukprot:CAMPEP_0194047350 /NCGR_PEP_ID=MMETSP0009_2-20130614/24134_1 /TAXON_ID=210454 /ORGANISM="Grammatophora oceanica, Strain CCMP 410" /LENGTH=296 /DNA_ID=CAMNT_0038692939 /DNA_START=96 /DNA_END=986 /DNA_ORIENTATION=+